MSQEHSSLSILSNRKAVKTSSDWLNLFSVNSTLPSSIDDPSKMYYSGSTYSASSGSTPPSLRKYGNSSYRETSSYYSSSSREYRSPYSSTTSSYLRSSSRPFTSRFLKSRYLSSSDDESNETDEEKRRQNNVDNDANTSNGEQQNNGGVVVVDRPTVLNGSVVRIRHRREVSTSDEEEEEEDEKEEEVPEEPKEPSVEPEPEEDPLDVEERELNSKLMLSLTLTLVDEENIRQRLLEIRKTRLRQREREATEIALVQKFQKVADVALFENQTITSKEEEEKSLIQRLTAESLSDVDRKDTHVRLQEIFRDQRNALDKSLREVELHYEHILQETSTEITELETSLRNKAEQVEKLQNEMLTMTVRKELLSCGMEQVNESHSERVRALNASISKIESKMSDFAVIVVQSNSSLTTSTTSNNADSALNVERTEELRELERELECPVCMDISQPPIYQCEEGHIICSNCKPLLTNCPHNCGQRYSEPAIRCRFAEKLAERYFKAIMKLRKESSSSAVQK